MERHHQPHPLPHRIKAVVQQTSVPLRQLRAELRHKLRLSLRPGLLRRTLRFPGIDLQAQVLDQMEFMPKIAPDLKLMDSRIFREGKMGLADEK